MSDEFEMYQSQYSSSISESDIKEQLPFVLAKTNFVDLGQKIEGKVRDSYVKGDVRYLITTDRLSCFDVVFASVPFKGQVLNEMAVHWFEKTNHIVSNHLIDVPHSNVMVVRNVEIIPVEVVVRGYLTGSAYRDYQSGKDVSGIRLPDGLKNSQKFETPLVTPSTKAPIGDHDQPISEAEVVSSGLVEKKIWDEVHEIALALFALGQQLARKQGLILVDTKYEFGLLDGKVVLADEIHTLDSSRYWLAASHQSKFESGDAPDMLDKEPARQWLIKNGFMGEGGIPEITDEHVVRISQHYISSYEKITGKIFSGKVGNVSNSIAEALLNK